MQQVMLRKGIPDTVVKLVIALYEAPRVLQLGELAIWTDAQRRNGLAAGCPIAVHALGMVTDSLLHAISQMPCASLRRGFVDDLVIASDVEAANPFQDF
eukprot:4422021-Amphidinium_carterae.1